VIDRRGRWPSLLLDNRRGDAEGHSPSEAATPPLESQRADGPHTQRHRPDSGRKPQSQPSQGDSHARPLRPSDVTGSSAQVWAAGYVGTCTSSTRRGNRRRGLDRALDRISALNQVGTRTEELPGTVAALARGLVDRCRTLTLEIKELTAEITALVSRMAPSLIEIPGCGAITAA